MAGVSSKAVGKLQNNYKFNEGTELNNDLDIGLYETDFRSYDAQIGRFLQIDELADFNFDYSPYTFGNDSPILMNDPLGLESEIAIFRKKKETSTKEKPKQLAGVVVVGKRHKKTESTAAKVADIITNFVPFVGGGKDIYQGIRDGNPWQVALGAGSIALDIFTFGSSSVIEGSVKTLIKEGAETFALSEVQTITKGFIKKETEEGVYNILTRTGERYIGQSKNTIQRVISHFRNSGKLKKLGHELEDVIHYAMPGSTKTEREIYEQYIILQSGGVDNLINVVNPMGGRMTEYYQNIQSVIQKYNLPR